MKKWEFLKWSPYVFPAESMADTLADTELSDEQILVREAIQNCRDEHRDDIEDPVLIKVERLSLRGEEKAKFAAALDLETIDVRKGAFQDAYSWFSKGEKVLKDLRNPDVPFPIISISDHNTNGLGGTWDNSRSDSDRFNNLVMSIAGSRKQEKSEGDQNAVTKLGSFGYGKMAFAKCSDLRTIIYYSTFKPDEGSEKQCCRAIGAGYYTSHEFEDQRWAGQAWFGAPSRHEQIPIAPLVGAEAHKWINELGLKERADSDTGTTVIIPACTIEIKDLVGEYEKWWWPISLERNPDRQLRIKFFDNGREIEGPDPRSRPRLNSFLECYKRLHLKNVSDDTSFKSFQINVRPQGKRKVAGTLVLHRPDAEDTVQGPEPGDDNDLENNIALIRDGLVIRYENNFAKDDKTPIVGVFEPAADESRVYMLSEPPAHDKWIKNAARLSEISWGQDFIRLTLRRIATIVNDYQASFEDRPEALATDAAAFLDKILGPFFRRGRQGANPTPDPYIRAVAIRRFADRRVLSGSTADISVSYRIALSKNTDEETADLDVSISLQPLVGSDGTAKDFIHCKVTNSKGNVLADGKNRQFRVTIQKGQTIELHAEAKIHADWRTKWSIITEKAYGDENA